MVLKTKYAQLPLPLMPWGSFKHSISPPVLQSRPEVFDGEGCPFLEAERRATGDEALT